MDLALEKLTLVARTDILRHNLIDRMMETRQKK